MKIGQSLGLLIDAATAQSAVPPTSIPEPGGLIVHPRYANEAILVPRDSPVRFRRFDAEDNAHFDGRFVLTGRYRYACAADCEGPVRQRFARFDLVPDRDIAARLPRWRGRHQDMVVTVDGGNRLLRAILSPRQRAALRAGTLDARAGESRW